MRGPVKRNKEEKKKDMKRFFEIVSGVFSPMMMATYGVAMALLLSPIVNYVAVGQLVRVLAVIAVVTGLLPLAVIAGLCRSGKISGGMDVPDRRQRLVPYATALVGMALGLLYLYNAAAPWWVLGFMIGGMCAVVVNMLVNRWWKISGHMAGMCALLGVVLGMSIGGVASSSTMLWWTMGVAMACALVAAARLYLRRHSALQLLAGFVNGVVWTVVLTAL